MSSSSYPAISSAAMGFGRCLAAFLQAPGLPFADVLTEPQIEEAFAAEGATFGRSKRGIYTPCLTLWAFLWQMLHGGVLRSCAAAVSRVLCTVRGDKVPSSDTGNYCRARAKLQYRRLRHEAGASSAECVVVGFRHSGLEYE